MHCWASAPEAIEFKTKLGFNQHDLIMTKEQSVSTKIMKAFSNEETLPQHSALSYKINLYFSEHKLAIEIDEKGHNVRNIDYEIKRQKAIKNKLYFKFIRTNPDGKDFDVYVESGKIYNGIIESTRKLTRNH